MSQRNRSASVRIPMYSNNPKAKRLEFRCPDPTGNGYLMFPAMMMAVLDGIENQIDPGDPLDRDIYEMTVAELAETAHTPGSLPEALEALASDHQFLIKGDVFTDDLIETTLPVLSTVASNSPQNVSVTFDISPRPDIVLSTNSVTFQQADANGTPPQDEVVNITRGGSGSWPLTGLNVAQITFTGGGATGWLSASLSATDAPSDLTLSVSTTGLVPGTTYTATVDIASPVAGNSPQQISVTFTTN